jgi:hypothetical protein
MNEVVMDMQKFHLPRMRMNKPCCDGHGQSLTALYRQRCMVTPKFQLVHMWANAPLRWMNEVVMYQPERSSLWLCKLGVKCTCQCRQQTINFKQKANKKQTKSKTIQILCQACDKLTHNSGKQYTEQASAQQHR